VHPSLITDRAALARTIESIEAAGVVAVDCEFHTPGLYFPRLCLVQVAVEGEAWAIDPRLDLTALGPILQNERITKILHDGRQDLAILARASGAVAVRGVLDTQIAAAFLGHGGSVGYAALVRDLLGVELDKSSQVSDWTGTLTTAQIEYALNDVRHLEEIASHLRTRLEETARLPWAKSSFDEAAERALKRPDPERLYQKVQGASRLGPEALGVLREAAKWRDRVAQAIDRPLAHVASDAALRQVAEKKPRDVAAASAIRGLGAGRADRWLGALVSAVEVGVCRPEPKRALAVRDDARIDGITQALSLARRVVAAREGIASELLADREELEALAAWQLGGRVGEEPEGPLKGWRRALLGELLLRVLAGDARLRVEPAAPAAIAIE
jgi:ribonuclease D